MSTTIYLTKNETLIRIDVAAQTVTEIKMDDNLSTSEIDKTAKQYRFNPHVLNVLHEIVAAYIREGFAVTSSREYADLRPSDLLVG